VQELVEDVAHFPHRRFIPSVARSIRRSYRTETRKYNYVAPSQSRSLDFLTWIEYRADKLNLAGISRPDCSTGFVTLALVFHPDMRDNFDLSCEGLGLARAGNLARAFPPA